MEARTIKKLLRVGFYCAPLMAYAANFTGSRAASAPLRTGTNPSGGSVKVAINKSGGSSPANPFAPAASPQVAPSSFGAFGTRTNVRAVKSLIRDRANDYGVSPFLALWIVKHESSFNPQAKGDGEASRGLWQISRVYHPEVPDAVAFDAGSSTDWSLQRIRDGKVNEWSAYRNCRTLYRDCPF